MCSLPLLEDEDDNVLGSIRRLKSMSVMPRHVSHLTDMLVANLTELLQE